MFLTCPQCKSNKSVTCTLNSLYRRVPCSASCRDMCWRLIPLFCFVIQLLSSGSGLCLLFMFKTFASLMHKFLFQLCERKKHPVAPRSLIADRILTQLTWLHADVFSVFCSSHWLILYKAKRTTQIENQLAPVIFVNLHKLKASCHLLELSCQNQTKQYCIRRCHK